MHRHDGLARFVTKHPGSKSRRKHMKRDKRRDRNLLHRQVRYAKLDTLNQAIIDEVQR